MRAFQPLKSFNEAAAFAAEQLFGAIPNNAPVLSASMRLRLSPQSNRAQVDERLHHLLASMRLRLSPQSNRGAAVRARASAPLQ